MPGFATALDLNAVELVFDAAVAGLRWNGTGVFIARCSRCFGSCAQFAAADRSWVLCVPGFYQISPVNLFVANQAIVITYHFPAIFNLFRPHLPDDLCASVVSAPPKAVSRMLISPSIACST